ncbi:BatA domain-containing protein [Tahibacter soli]|uniref:BatA domain-containing protein n=1 Tax=Tahibacter soli TaxID=2983605 RepID=A0A9X3YJT2_9GAMM|nr:BatA domain-containing protein [Tahibacter soli]MDC8013597.1 BatA domain-containing protein [Tahibacter soli]
MSLAFALPLGFAALAAWALPLLIHLSRRADRRETPFAALRFVRGPERPRRRLRLEHPWLLAARLALIGAIAFLLAEPVLDAATRDERAWVAVVPGADLAQARRLADANASWHWVAPGFPAIGATGAAPDVDARASISSLLRELDANLARETALTVVAPADLGGLDAERIALGRAVQWQVVAGASPQPDTKTPLRTLALRGAPDAAALPHLRAAVAAWNTPAQRWRLDERAADAPPGDADVIARLGADATRDDLARANDGAVVVTDRANDGAAAWLDGDGRVLARVTAHGRGRVIGLAQPLTPAALPLLLESTFAHDFERLVAGPATPTRAPADAVAPLVEARATTPARTAAAGIDDMLILVIALLALVERGLAWHAARKAPAS